ncbi:MAG: tetratricopeptide repeat protein [Candidatus Poribacteria bacterium]|nr:tetratricopeptide repeat protein [Candidatus Poribacteria bacterium]
MVTHKPKDTESYYNRGIAYYEKREYDKAIADFSEVIKRNSDHADAYYNRGNAYCDEVDCDKAIADYTYRGERECYSKVSLSLYGENPNPGAEDFDMEITERTWRMPKARPLVVLNLKGTLYGKND